jgi:hypothetical protein
MSKYTDAVSRGLKSLTAVSIGECPGCPQCAKNHGMTPKAHERAWRSGTLLETEGSFSWRPCGICGTKLGGNRECWHAIDADKPVAGGEILHFEDACTDCVMYLANGDEPDRWYETEKQARDEGPVRS